MFRLRDGRFAFSRQHADWALLRKRGRLRGFLIFGVVNAAVPYSLIAAAEVNLTASWGAILN